jgi:asparagine synthase (glutamine-hydrolysing)
MCAICGVFRVDGRTVEPTRVERMRDAMSLRGPDAADFSAGPGFALGHRRLAIIDLSDAGRQPMPNEDGSVQLILNGEIYNFHELQKELLAAGHRFRSHSDTEVLVHGYEEWGLERLLSRIRGMYAFALVDQNSGEIHLARDPLGKKPLFFRWANGELVFASSSRALTLGVDAPLSIDPRAIPDLLSNLYIPGPRTFFQGVEKVLPGHSVTVDRRGVRRDHRHWAPDFFHAEAGVDEDVWLDRIDAALHTAVRRRLIADVPLGLLLSGGVDSGLVTAIAAQEAGSVKTFSVAADDESLDESPYAAAVAERYHTEHHVLKVSSNVRALLPLLVESLGEPMADASALNFVGISTLARQSVTVVLTGDGGDEGFGGYSTFWAYFHAARLAGWLPSSTHPPLARIADVMEGMSGPFGRASTLLKLATHPVEETFAGGRWLRGDQRDSLFTEPFRAVLRGHDSSAHYRRALTSSNGATVVDRVMQAHLLTTLPDDYLAKADCGSMAASVEARSPLLDQDLIELAMKIPLNVRFKGGTPKGLLRKLAYRYLPRHVIDRRKQGFVAPVGKWLREDWQDLVQDTGLGTHVERRGWFRRSALERIVADHQTGRDRGYLLWTLMILELWTRMAVDRTLPPGSSI